MNELSALSWILHNSSDYAILENILKQYHFHDQFLRDIWTVAKESYDRYAIFPTRDELSYLLQTKYATDISLSTYMQVSDSVWGTATTEVTAGAVKEWAVRKETSELASALLELARSDMENKLPIDQITKLRHRMELLEQAEANTDASFFNPLDPTQIDRMEDYVEELYGGDVIPTGLPRIDRKLRDGGMRTHLSLLFGPSGIGKTVVAFAMVMFNLLLGRRILYVTLDDNPGELTERMYSFLLKRPVSLREESLNGNLELVKSQVKQLVTTQYYGDFQGVHLDPRSYTTQDLVGMITAKQKQLYRMDQRNAAEFDIPEEEWGKIDLIVVDTMDQLKSAEGGGTDWAKVGNLAQEMSLLPKRFNCPALGVTQGNQAAEGASQITNRNMAEGYGKIRPAKFILGVQQTYAEYHNELFIDTSCNDVRVNLHRMWNYDPIVDAKYKWRQVGICITKNTRGAVGAGAINKVKIPMLVNFPTCRIVDDWTAAEELITVERLTKREEQEVQAPTTTGRSKPGRWNN